MKEVIKMMKLKLKMWVKMVIFILLLINEVVLYTMVGTGLSEKEIIIYTIGYLNTCGVLALGIHISEEKGYK